MEIVKHKCLVTALEQATDDSEYIVFEYEIVLKSGEKDKLKIVMPCRNEMGVCEISVYTYDIVEYIKEQREQKGHRIILSSREYYACDDEEAGRIFDEIANQSWK